MHSKATLTKIQTAVNVAVMARRSYKTSLCVYSNDAQRRMYTRLAYKACHSNAITVLMDHGASVSKAARLLHDLYRAKGLLIKPKTYGNTGN